MQNIFFVLLRTTTILLLLLLLLSHKTFAAPLPQNDIDSSYSVGSAAGAGSGNGIVDYNTVVGHFKDFFMYFPVMMTTFKETMSGFPKFAEGLRILTSKNGRLEEDCKCKFGSNEIENSSRYS